MLLINRISDNLRLSQYLVYADSVVQKHECVSTLISVIV